MVKKKIQRGFEEDWEYIESVKEPPYGITGKYLFFSSDRELLIEIAKDEILNHDFHIAKLPIEGKSIGTDYVLCLYYKDISRQHELARRYRNREGVRFRWWKSDQDTANHKYSERFYKDLMNGSEE